MPIRNPDPYLDPEKIYGSDHIRNRIRNITDYVLVGERDLEVDWLVPYLDPEKFTDMTTSEPDLQHYSLCSCRREVP